MVDKLSFALGLAVGGEWNCLRAGSIASAQVAGAGMVYSGGGNRGSLGDVSLARETASMRPRPEASGAFTAAYGVTAVPCGALSAAARGAVTVCAAAGWLYTGDEITEITEIIERSDKSMDMNRSIGVERLIFHSVKGRTDENEALVRPAGETVTVTAAMEGNGNG